MITMTVYEYDPQGYYIGKNSCYGEAIPNNCATVVPTLREGFIPRWNGNAWEQVETHVGEQGFVGGRPVVIGEPGPLPDGWSAEFVDPRSPAEIRRQEIRAELGHIDFRSVRPMRALLAGVAGDDDTALLATLERRAEELRKELSVLHNY